MGITFNELYPKKFLQNARIKNEKLVAFVKKFISKSFNDEK